MPILASTLYAANTSGHKRRRLTTGRISIDDNALIGGLEYGKDGIVCISGSVEDSGEVALAFLASHLLNHAPGPAFYIDTLGAFPALHLQHLLKVGLRNKSSTSDENTSAAQVSTTGDAEDAIDADQQDDAAIDAEVELMLGRVSVMRIFDFIGFTEVLDEIKQHLSTHLPSSLPPPPSPAPSPSLHSPSPSPSPPTSAPPTQDHPPRPLPTLLILNNLPQILLPLLHRAPATAHALLTTHLRTLHHLTRAHDAVALLLNTTVAAFAPAAPVVPLSTNLNHQPASWTAASASSSSSSSAAAAAAAASAAPGPGPSVFAALAHVRPALGRVLGFLLDVGLLVADLRAARDGGAAGGSNNDGGGEAKDREVVLEVLVDRGGRREGRWGFF